MSYSHVFRHSNFSVTSIFKPPVTGDDTDNLKNISHEQIVKFDQNRAKKVKFDSFTAGLRGGYHDIGCLLISNKLVPLVMFFFCRWPFGVPYPS